MPFTFGFLGVLFWLIAFAAAGIAKSSIHEGVAAIIFLNGTLCMGFGAVVSVLNRIHRQVQAPAAAATPVATPSPRRAPEDRLFYVRAGDAAAETGPLHARQIRAMWLAGQLTEAAQLRLTHSQNWNAISALSTEWKAES